MKRIYDAESGIYIYSSPVSNSLSVRSVALQSPYSLSQLSYAHCALFPGTAPRLNRLFCVSSAASSSASRNYFQSNNLSPVVSRF